MFPLRFRWEQRLLPSSATKRGPKRPSSPKDCGFMRVLIADDNALVREGIAEILADNAWEVCGQVSNGPETLEQVRILRPDVVLLDISMPGTNGLKIAATIRHDIPAVKVVIVSQHDFDHVLGDAQRELADGFVDKSRLGTDLVPTLARILANG